MRQEKDFLTPAKYTLRDFKRWCVECGHHQGYELVRNFTRFVNSDYCSKAVKKTGTNK